MPTRRLTLYYAFVCCSRLAFATRGRFVLTCLPGIYLLPVGEFFWFVAFRRFAFLFLAGWRYAAPLFCRFLRYAIASRVARYNR